MYDAKSIDIGSPRIFLDENVCGIAPSWDGDASFDGDVQEVVKALEKNGVLD